MADQDQEVQGFMPDPWRYAPQQGSMAPLSQPQEGDSADLSRLLRPRQPDPAIEALGGEAMKEQLEAGREGIDIEKRRAAEMGPMREKMLKSQQDFNDSTQSMIKDYQSKLQTVGKPPNLMAQMSEDMNNWFMWAAALGALAGAFTRKPMTSALNAFSGAIQGFREGDQQKFANQMSEWKQKSDLARANNQQLLQEMELQFKAKKMTLDTQMAEMEIIGAKYQDQALVNAARQKNATLVANYYFQLKQLDMNLEEHQMKMQTDVIKLLSGTNGKSTRLNTFEGMQQFVNEQQRLQTIIQQLPKDDPRRKQAEYRYKMNEWYMNWAATDPTGALHGRPMPQMEGEEAEGGESDGRPWYYKLFGLPAPNKGAGGSAGPGSQAGGTGEGGPPAAAGGTFPDFDKSQAPPDWKGAMGSDEPAGFLGRQAGQQFSERWNQAKRLRESPGSNSDVPIPTDKSQRQTWTVGKWYDVQGYGVGQYLGDGKFAHPGEAGATGQGEQGPRKLYQGYGTPGGAAGAPQAPAEMGT